MLRFVDHLCFFACFVGWRIALLVVFALGMGVAETVGLAMFMPLLELGMSGTPGDDKISRLVAGAVQFLGLPLAFAPMIALIVVIFAVKGLLVFGLRTATAAIQLDVQEGMRLHLVESAQKTSYRHWIGQKLGDVNNVLVREIDMSNKNLKACVTLIETGVLITIFVAAISWVNPLVGAICIAFAGLIFVIFRAVNLNSGTLSIAATEESGAIQRLALQILQNFKLLKSTGAFAPLRAHLEERIVTRRRLMMRLQVYTAIIRSAAEPLAVLVVAAFILFMTNHAGVALTTAILPLLLLYRSLTQVQQMNAAWNMFMQSIGALRAYRAMTDSLAGHTEVTSGAAAPRLSEGIALNRVNLAYATGGRAALHDVSMEIPAGRTVGIVGETGAGKTTLVDVITGLLAPTAGRIAWDGHDFAKLDMESLRARIGYVTQDPVIFDDTAGNNITGWQAYRDANGDILPDVLDVCRSAQCLDVIEATEDGFDTVLGERGIRLSGGQRQRIAIARELFRRPDLLIFDEGTSSLDVETETALVETIERLSHRWTMVIIAHRFATIRNCDLIYVLSAGKVVDSGDWNELANRTDSWFTRASHMQNIA